MPLQNGSISFRYVPQVSCFDVMFHKLNFITPSAERPHLNLFISVIFQYGVLLVHLLSSLLHIPDHCNYFIFQCPLINLLFSYPLIIMIPSSDPSIPLLALYNFLFRGLASVRVSDPYAMTGRTHWLETLRSKHNGRDFPYVNLLPESLPAKPCTSFYFRFQRGTYSYQLS